MWPRRRKLLAGTREAFACPRDNLFHVATLGTPPGPAEEEVSLVTLLSP